MLKPYNKAELSFQLGNAIGGEGRNSEVFIAYDPQLDARIVIKKIRKADFSDPDDYFLESSILHLSGHPNVVPIHYACEDDEFIYIAMPHYERGSLNMMMNDRFLTVREIVRLATQFLSGLHNIHSKGLVHFDIKPDNILISNQGEAQISDFGLSRRMSYDGLAGQDRNYLKTVPPEAYATDQHTIAYDIYQSGLSLYRMCFGNQYFYSQFDEYGDLASFDRESFKFDVVNGRFPKRANFLEHIPTALTSVVKASLSTDPSERPPSAIHMINGLAEIDEKLMDWQYTEESDGSRKWEKVTEDRTIILEVTSDGQATAQKEIAASGNVSRISDYCIETISKRQIKAFLGKY